MPVLVATSQELIAAGAGALVAVISGILLVYRFDETWISYRSTWSSLLREKMLHETRVEPYDKEAARYERLVRRVESILASESDAWVELRAATSKPE